MKLRVLVVSFIFGIALAACGRAPNFGLEPVDTGFAQKVTYNHKIDVLWVVDNSSSMAHHQQNIANQISSFVDVLNEKKMEYRMAITTTDVGAHGAKGSFVGIPKVLSFEMSNVKNLFSQNILVGEDGSDLEQGLDAMKRALSAPLINTTNSGFLRSDAVLVVVFIANEDDKSSGTSASYAQFLDQVKPAFAYGARGWQANFIGITDPNGSCKTMGEYGDPGDRYIDLVKTSGGSSESVCSNDLSGALSNIRARISEMITAFHLEREPDVLTIVVTVDGTLIPNDEQNGWTYEPKEQVIQFHGASIPPADADVRIGYQPKSVKQ